MRSQSSYEAQTPPQAFTSWNESPSLMTSPFSTLMNASVV
jgi:hypothetical protein